MKNLTTRQRDVFEYIQKTIETRGISPTIREIQHHFRFNSPNAATVHLRALSKKGYIETESQISRGIKIPGMRAKMSDRLPMMKKSHLLSSHAKDYFTVDQKLFQNAPSALYQIPDNTMKLYGIIKNDIVCLQENYEKVVVDDLVLAIESKKIIAGVIKKKDGLLQVFVTKNELYTPIKNFVKIIKIVGYIRSL